MKRGDKEMGILGIWSAILVSAILSGFAMVFEEGGEGLRHHEA